MCSLPCRIGRSPQFLTKLLTSGIDQTCSAFAFCGALGMLFTFSTGFDISILLHFFVLQLSDFQAATWYSPLTRTRGHSQVSESRRVLREIGPLVLVPASGQKCPEACAATMR